MQGEEVHIDEAHVFDKAAYHLASVRNRGLDDHQAFVHVGLFFGWAVRRGLVAAWLEDRTPHAFAAFRKGARTGPQLIEEWDGALLDDMFTDEGLAFAASYLPEPYFEDYGATLVEGLESPFHVADDAESAARLEEVLDARFEAWRATWDPSTGRPDLRSPKQRPGAPEPFEGRAVVGVVPVAGGVALPGGPLGMQASRRETVEALRAAYALERWVALVPTLTGLAAHRPDDLGPIGVLGYPVEVTDHGDSLTAVLACRSRVGVLRWVEEATWQAEVRVLPETEVTAADADPVEALRHAVGEVLRRRRARGEAVGLLAFAPGLPPSDLVDVSAREAGLTFEEQLLVLEEPSVAARAEIVQLGLRRL